MGTVAQGDILGVDILGNAAMNLIAVWIACLFLTFDVLFIGPIRWWLPGTFALTWTIGSAVCRRYRLHPFQEFNF